MIKKLLLAAAVALAPIASYAVTVVSPGDYSTAPLGGTVLPNSTAEIMFDVTEPLKIFFSVTATDPAAGESIKLSVTGSDIVGDVYFSEPIATGGVAVAFAFFDFIATGPFTVFAEVMDATTPVTFGVSYVTAPVPVPAAGLLLGTALVGGAFAAKRRKRELA